MQRIRSGIGILLSLVAIALMVNIVTVPPSHAQEPPKTVPAKLAAPVFREYRRPVTIWVPPYAVAKSKAQLTASFENVGMKDAITHLALQFWIPTTQGTVEQVKMEEVKDSAI